VRPAGGGNFMTLAPRVRIHAAPYAWAAFPVGPAAGDLAGNYPNPLVVGFRGLPLAAVQCGEPAECRRLPVLGRRLLETRRRRRRGRTRERRPLVLERWRTQVAADGCRARGRQCARLERQRLGAWCDSPWRPRRRRPVRQLSEPDGRRAARTPRLAEPSPNGAGAEVGRTDVDACERPDRRQLHAAVHGRRSRAKRRDLLHRQPCPDGSSGCDFGRVRQHERRGHLRRGDRHNGRGVWRDWTQREPERTRRVRRGDGVVGQHLRDVRARQQQ
jgi:hypothetical protein